ncbi:MAG: GNAT family N-acetyltransferase [Oscillospiraceae bacterium]|nr:GNAT family N-acetyltransferase [Oscillospiraceae bacterium]
MTCTFLDFSRFNHPDFPDMMIQYIVELGDQTPENDLRQKLLPFIEKQLNAGIIRIALAIADGALAGFSVYQIDTQESDWCKRPGWGFIREFYVCPKYRSCGIGMQLAKHTEQLLRKMGANQLYLTSGPAVPFWERCGWSNTHEQCSNDLSILVKRI